MNCPVCSKPMESRSSYGEVQIDICKEHGIWLEKNELSRILEGYGEANRRLPNSDADSRQRGRFEGIFLGWLSLLIPK